MTGYNLKLQKGLHHKLIGCHHHNPSVSPYCAVYILVDLIGAVKGLRAHMKYSGFLFFPRSYFFLLISFLSQALYHNFFW